MKHIINEMKRCRLCSFIHLGCLIIALAIILCACGGSEDTVDNSIAVSSYVDEKKPEFAEEVQEALVDNVFAEEDKVESEDIVGKVTGVTAEPGDYSVTVRWETVDGADGYCIYKSTDNKEFKAYKYSSHNGKSFSGLENGVEYYFGVAAYQIIDNCEVYGEMSDSVAVVPDNLYLTMSDSYLVLESGEEWELYARLHDEKQDVTWISSDESVVTVAQNGLVTAVGAGKAVISAILGSSDEEKTECTVEVDRKYPEENTEVKARFVKGEDGIWTNGGNSNEAVLLFTGDLMALEKQMKDADSGDGFHYDFYPSFANVAEEFSKGDLVVGNLETTLTEKFPYNNDLSKYMKISNCNTSPSYLDALRDAGFDMLTTANNHYCDAGVDGVIDTIDRLDDYGFMHTGTYKSAEEDRFVIAEVNGIKIGVINYNQKSTNGKDSMLTEVQQKLMLGKFYRSRVPENIAAARERGAEFIIVCLHFGTQNTVAVTDTQLSIAQYVADEGADLIVCSHPHILQKFDYVTAADGRVVPCAYSLGNFCSSMAELDTNKYNIIFNVGIKKDEGKVTITDISYVPCAILPKYDGHKYVITPTGFTSELLSEDNKAELKAAHSSIVETIGNKMAPQCEP